MESSASRFATKVVQDITSDGLAPEPYIRESRRIQAEDTVKEHAISLEARGDQGPTKFPDSVGIGAYRIDLHPSTGGDNYIDLSVWPFQIPLGAFIPVRISTGRLATSVGSYTISSGTGPYPGAGTQR